MDVWGNFVTTELPAKKIQDKTVTQKVAKQERSEFYVFRTVIACTADFRFVKE